MIISLSVREYDYLLEIEEKYKNSRSVIINFTDDEFQKYRKVIELLCRHNVLRDEAIDNANAYRRIGDFEGFRDLLAKEDKTLSINGFEMELIDLLERAKTINQSTQLSYKGGSIADNNLTANVWIDDVQIFCSKYLKEHPLFSPMEAQLFHRNFSRLVASLTSISKDKDFIDKMNGVEKVESTKRQAKALHEYDVFLSHADKDKITYVNNLYKSLSTLGVNIYYDKVSNEWGDMWKEHILDGTAKSEFAIIVISHNYFDRVWTEKELKEFLNRQNEEGQKIILPIIHNITLEQLREKYPYIADIQVLDSSKYTCNQIALLFAKQLIKRLKANID